MTAVIKSRSTTSVTIEITVPLGSSMLQGEVDIENAINEAGTLASSELLKRFDTDGSAIVIGDIRFTSKGLFEKNYQTPYGETRIERHLYQSSKGGATFCPLDRDARVVQHATPKLAKQLSHKYSKFSASETQLDLNSNHGRHLSRQYIQVVAETVASIAQAKEESWSYATPKLDDEVKSVGIGLDGTTVFMRDEGYRIAMVGTIALYNREGERLHTTYTAASPEYGKEKFFARLTQEVEHVKHLYPEALYVGLADGAADNWSYLNSLTDLQVTDFWHASEYLAGAADAIYPRTKGKREQWLKDQCHNLKHKKGAAGRIIKQLSDALPSIRAKSAKDKLQRCITYFTHQKKRMRYSSMVEKQLPIGSGVTEAACKTIVKQRLCQSGMKWRDRGASIILSLRTLERSDRWEQFWNKIDQYGIAV